MQEDPSYQHLSLIAQTIFQKKGFNILALDVRGVSTLTDFFVIAEGTVDRHVIGLGKEVMEVLKTKSDMYPIHIEGITVGDWVVLDYMEIVVHLFTPAMREMYRLEEVWQEGKVVELDLGHVIEVRA